MASTSTVEAVKDRIGLGVSVVVDVMACTSNKGGGGSSTDVLDSASGRMSPLAGPNDGGGGSPPEGSSWKARGTEFVAITTSFVCTFGAWSLLGPPVGPRWSFSCTPSMAGADEDLLSHWKASRGDRHT